MLTREVMCFGVSVYNRTHKQHNVNSGGDVFWGPCTCRTHKQHDVDAGGDV